jgi:cytochrome c biogenesis factor
MSSINMPCSAYSRLNNHHSILNTSSTKIYLVLEAYIHHDPIIVSLNEFFLSRKDHLIMFPLLLLLFSLMIETNKSRFNRVSITQGNKKTHWGREKCLVYENVVVHYFFFLVFPQYNR